MSAFLVSVARARDKAALPTPFADYMDGLYAPLTAIDVVVGL